MPPSIISEDQHQQSPMLTSKECKGDQCHPVLSTAHWAIFIYFLTSCVLSSICFSKTSLALFLGCLQKKKSVLSKISSHMSSSAKVSSHKTVSRKISHDTTSSPKKPEIFTSLRSDFQRFREQRYMVVIYIKIYDWIYKLCMGMHWHMHILAPVIKLLRKCGVN